MMTVARAGRWWYIYIQEAVVRVILECDGSWENGQPWWGKRADIYCVQLRRSTASCISDTPDLIQLKATFAIILSLSCTTLLRLPHCFFSSHGYNVHQEPPVDCVVQLVASLAIYKDLTSHSCLPLFYPINLVQYTSYPLYS